MKTKYNPSNMKKFQHLLIMALISLPFLSQAQVLDYMDIKLRIVEKVGTETQPLPNTTLNITDVGELTTDDEGNVNFPYAIRNNVDPRVSISLMSNEQRVIKPLDASIALDTAREEMFIEFLVVNMANESAQFKKRIRDLERDISSLKAKNQLTKRQLEAMHNQLIDTILHFENIRRGLESEIEGLSFENEEQRKELEQKNQQIEELSYQIDDLTAQLKEALQERYHQKKVHYDDITSILASYIRKAKDLKNHLAWVKHYAAGRGTQNYINAINEYNDTFKEMDDKRAGHIASVANYWEKTPRIARDLEDLYNFTVKSVHAQVMLPIFNDLLEEFAKQRPKKAEKLAQEASEPLEVNLRDLERRINRVEKGLRKTLHEL